MKPSEKLIAIFIALSFLFVIPAVRSFVSSVLVKTAYVPILKAEASILDFLEIRKERELLEREITLLKREQGAERLSQYLAVEELKSEVALPIAFNPMGIPTTIVLNKGTESGIEYGQPVLQLGNLAGKVISSSEGFSSFLTLLSEEMKVGVVDTRSGVLGVLKGGLSPKLLYIPEWADVKVGDTLVTSGLGGVFPRWIPVGIIRTVNLPKGPFYRDIDVKLFVDYHQLSCYQVLKK